MECKRKLLFELLVRGERALLRQEVGQFTGGEMAALLYLATEENGISSAQLGKHLEVSPSRVVAMVKSMARKKYITTRAEPRDRRVMRLLLTDSGRMEVTRAYQRGLGELTSVMDYLGEKDSGELTRILSRLQDYQRQADATADWKQAMGDLG